MRYHYVKREFPGSNPIANVLVILAGAVIVSLALILGFFAFLALGALVLVSAGIVGLRLWWLRRKLARQAPVRPETGKRPVAGVIEGEYHVVREESEKP